MQRKQIHLPPAQIEELQKLSRSKGVSFAEMVRTAIDWFLHFRQNSSEKIDLGDWSHYFKDKKDGE